LNWINYLWLETNAKEDATMPMGTKRKGKKKGTKKRKMKKAKKYGY
jgi:hypothetical protein